MSRTKRCSKCRIPKMVGDFYKSPLSRDGLRSWCKKCSALCSKTGHLKRPVTQEAVGRRQAYMQAYKRTSEFRQRAAELKRAKPVEYHMFQSARVRAREKGLEFDITIEDIVVPEVCPLLGIAIKRGTGLATPNSPTLDRKDTALGYVRGNVWVVSWRANRIKSDATADEIRLLAKRLTENGL